MKGFSFNRFCQTLRWYLSVYFRNLTMWTIGYAVLAFLGEMLMWQVKVNGTNDIEPALRLSSQFFTFFIIIALAVGLSTIFYDMNKKARRVSLLMLPATNLEKFLVAVFYVTVVWTLGVFLSFAVGDTLRIAVRSLFYGDQWVSGIPALVDTMMPKGFQRLWIPEMVFVVLLQVFIHSAYILGGTWLRKYAFVIVCIVLNVIPIVASYVLHSYGISISLFSWQDAHGGHYVNPIVYALDLVFILLAAFNYWASFRIFKHFELISNKWMNYDIFKR